MVIYITKDDEAEVRLHDWDEVIDYVKYRLHEDDINTEINHELTTSLMRIEKEQKIGRLK
jgi:hypothetical protein